MNQLISVPRLNSLLRIWAKATPWWYGGPTVWPAPYTSSIGNEEPPVARWPSVGPNVFVPVIRECVCGATWLGEPDEKMVGLYWWSLFRMPAWL